MKNIIDHQIDFDKRHKGWFWDPTADRATMLQNLQHAAIATSGEVGEFNNVVKKIMRESGHDGNVNPQLWENLKEEAADIFIYLVKIGIMLGMDLEGEYFKKMKFNEQRFKKFEVQKK